MIAEIYLLDVQQIDNDTFVFINSTNRFSSQNVNETQTYFNMFAPFYHCPFP